MQRLVIATHNSHKTEEIRQILGHLISEIMDLNSFPAIEPAVEDGETFVANATIKALHASRHLPDDLVLADDSGLEVDALEGAPGVYSARYAGADATDASNRELLLQRMENQANRDARFRCVLVLAHGDEVLESCYGVVEGRIADSEQGGGGFGYDPIFIPEQHEVTFAELPPESKNAISHRGRALLAVRKALQEHLDRA